MNRIRYALAAVALLTAPSAFAAESVAPADRAPPPKTPSLMTATEIKAYNEGLPQTHRYYIKCRKSVEIGSLVKKSRVCHTNEGWKVALDRGNTSARETFEEMTSKAGNSN